ncbi:somatomedin-B and thrombospondin type-1 domain-containing protein-like [Schistocerca nitens]|uniref:somatomedin-B and thrombospondin type-1 domain-containing protein-like n=1 Tax=Schistocerca nitens TaxID=7011 RepID=UPI0021177671|nr:somatomedin-B and thrombospondin type-1 domain-containing protein-like [Schistocerca nitens]
MAAAISEPPLMTAERSDSRLCHCRLGFLKGRGSVGGGGGTSRPASQTSRAEDHLARGHCHSGGSPVSQPVAAGGGSGGGLPLYSRSAPPPAWRRSEEDAQPRMTYLGLHGVPTVHLRLLVDCAVTAWGPWSECDADCGTGMMRRSRSVQRQPENGGKHCPSLLQKRGCQGTRCPHSNKSALKETAMLLPAKLGNSRRANETTDIRRNLRLRYPKQPHENNEYCVQFEVLKASKACRKETSYSSLREGERVCVRCESQALRPALGYRCAGPGVADRGTRWTALSAPHCHGKWLRLSHHDDQPSCPACANGASFIFV